MCQEVGIESDVIPRVASCFGGGIGNTGAVCGAVVGGVMAIGLVKERGETKADWLRLSATAQNFRTRFEREMKTIQCHELTGADLTTEAGREAFMNSEVPQTVCIPAVNTAYRLVMELAAENAGLGST